MENIADLLPFAIVAGLWLLRAIRGSKSKQQRPPVQATSESTKPSAPTPFEQLMRQLEQALEEPKADAEAQPATQKSSDPGRPSERKTERKPGRESERKSKRTEEPRATSKPPRAAPRAIDAPTAFEAAFDHEDHGFGIDNPSSEEAFEARPAFAPRRKAVEKDYDPHGLRSGRRQPKSPPKKTSKSQPQHQGPKPLRRGASAWAERLHDPAAAREALVLKTIFEGPWTPRSGKKER